MNRFLKAGLLVTGMTSSIAQADILGDEDDTYLGFQISTQLDSHYRGFRWDANQYRYRYLQRKNGIEDGIEISIDSLGGQRLNYVRSFAGYEGGGNGAEKIALPLLRLDAQARDGAGHSTVATVAGLVVLAYFISEFRNKCTYTTIALGGGRSC